jgi:nucleotide-binding universal stress UspA family protein
MYSSTSVPIIACSDLSMESDDAIRAGAEWARRTESPLEVVHVGPFGMLQSLQNRHLADTLLARLEGMIEALDVPARIVSLEGDVPEEIVRHAEKRGARLVVMAASKKGAAARFLLGSTADRVTRRAPCAVLIARPPASRGPVLVGTDFSDASALAVEMGAAEARSRRVPLLLAHSVFEPDPLSVLGPTVVANPTPRDDQRSVRTEAATRLLSTLLESTRAAGDIRVDAGEPGRALVSMAEVSGAELVVVATHGRGGLSRAALGSVSQFVVRHAPCSVLVARQSN